MGLLRVLGLEPLGLYLKNASVGALDGAETSTFENFKKTKAVEFSVFAFPFCTHVKTSHTQR
jgi:hypothetical protein